MVGRHRRLQRQRPSHRRHRIGVLPVPQLDARELREDVGERLGEGRLAGSGGRHVIQVAERFDHLPPVQQDHPEVDRRLRHAGLKLHRLPQHLRRLLRRPRLGISQAQIAEVGGLAGLKLHRALQRAHRLVAAPGVELQHPEQVMRAGVVGASLEDPLAHRAGLLAVSLAVVTKRALDAR